MPGGHTGFNPERLNRGCSSQRKLRDKRQEGARAALLEWVSVAGRQLSQGWARGEDAGTERPFRRPIGTG